MPQRMMITGTILALGITLDAAGQLPSPAGPVPGQPVSVAGYEKVVTGLLDNDFDDRLWKNLTPDARRELLDKVNQLEQDITVQGPVGPVAPKPVQPPPPKPKPVSSLSAPTFEDFEKSLAALQHALRKATKADPAYVLPAPVNAEMQLVVERLSNATRK